MASVTCDYSEAHDTVEGPGLWARERGVARLEKCGCIARPLPAPFLDPNLALTLGRQRALPLDHNLTFSSLASFFP